MVFILKGHILSQKMLSLITDRKCDSPETFILLLKPWNSICSRGYTCRKPNLSGGDPFSARKDVSLSFILNILNNRHLVIEQGIERVMSKRAFFLQFELGSKGTFKFKLIL